MLAAGVGCGAFTVVGGAFTVAGTVTVVPGALGALGTTVFGGVCGIGVGLLGTSHPNAAGCVDGFTCSPVTGFVGSLGAFGPRGFSMPGGGVVMASVGATSPLGGGSAGAPAGAAGANRSGVIGAYPSRARRRGR